MRPSDPNSLRRVLFYLFFLSGFCSLVYQMVWTRLAFAAFGIIMPVLSVVLSVFMLGLAIGSWVGGRAIRSLRQKTGLSAAAFYAAAEAIIGLGAFAVPNLFAYGQQLLLATGQTNSLSYLSSSALALAISIFPWCFCMGATFPFMIAYIREWDGEDTKCFSFLYLANVLGAMCGALLSALVLVEIFGFRHTLWFAAAGNFVIALTAIELAWEQRGGTRAPDAAEREESPRTAAFALNGRRLIIPWILFSTGFCAMAMEVVWTRAFTPVLKTQVYSFALIVFTYLGATFFGSWMYRRGLRKNYSVLFAQLLSILAVAAFLPVMANDSRLMVAQFWKGTPDPVSSLILLGSICPFCALLGYLTPGLIDQYAQGRPEPMGRAYAINVFGCILGPLVASYCLLPFVKERFVLILLALPFAAFGLVLYKPLRQSLRVLVGLAIGLVLAWSVWFTQDYEAALHKEMTPSVVRRDYAATVVSYGEGHDRWLLVNGIGMTSLTPITKFMAHLPLAFHRGPPQSALVICFGMGTSFRSALSWDIDTTAVELIPSVVKAFGFYHADAADYLANPKGHIVLDDGRRYLKRCGRKFDVIIVDPPPPIETAESSLLYSKEFYALARDHLQPGGILQMWYPGGKLDTGQAVIRSIYEAFPYVRGFQSAEGWGIHLLASAQPIEQLDADQFIAHMPLSARKDLMEWNNSPDDAAYAKLILSQEVPIARLLNPNPDVQITDDRPYNEYFLLRGRSF